MKTLNNAWILVAAMTISSSMITSCDNKEKEQLRAKAELLEKQLNERDSAFNSIMTVMSDVETQIEEIKAQEKLISTVNNGDFDQDNKTNMVNDLVKINELINNTNDKVANLSKQLESSNLKIGAFERRVQRMTKDLQEREGSLSQLREELAEKDEYISVLTTEVGSLTTRVQEQTETIDLQSTELEEREKNLNTAFFAVDTEKKLKEKGLVTKEGGFLFMGKTTEIQADAAQSNFTKVDIQDTKRFYIDSNKMEIITEHPSESYKLVNEDNKIKYLEVIDPVSFWKISKYLVISIKS